MTVAMEPQISSSALGDLVHAVSAINAADEVSLACHVNPDGDALGSMLGLHHCLIAAGRKSIASFPEPFVVARHYEMLPGLDLLTRPSAFPSAPELMATFDCGSIARLGGLGDCARAASELVVVDHHVSNDRYGTINFIDPDAAASSVLVYRLIRELGLPMTRDAAVCLFAALVCDTGRFQYESTSAGVFRMAAELMAFDIPVATLTRALFEEHRLAYLRLMGEALENMVLVSEKRFAWTAVRQSDLARHGVTIEEVEGLIDMVRRTAEAEVSCVLKEEADGSVRVSLRSLGAVDVRVIAESNGGGGHRFAAGFTSQSEISVVAALIADSL